MINLNIVFKAALVYKSDCIIKYGDPTSPSLFKSLELYGIGKYPHILAQSDSQSEKDTEIVLNFENVIVGQTAYKYFTLINLTEVVKY